MDICSSSSLHGEYCTLRQDLRCAENKITVFCSVQWRTSMHLDCDFIFQNLKQINLKFKICFKCPNTLHAITVLFLFALNAIVVYNHPDVQ